MVDMHSAEERDRHLRALYRQHRPASRWRGNKLILDQAQQAEQWRIVCAEYERLYGEAAREGILDHILKSAWIEERQLAGQSYDYVLQVWVGPHGERVQD